MRRQILLLTLLCLHIAARGQTITSLDDLDLSGLPQPTQVKALRYWFDDDAGSVQTVNNGSDTYLLETASLTDGLHTLHYQVIDSEENAAYISSSVFMKMDMSCNASIQSFRYWFDDDAGSIQTVNSGSDTYLLETASLTDGLHTLHYQVVGSDGSSYYVTSGIFMKMTRSSEMVTASKLMYWYDDETTLQTAELGDGVQMLNASELTEGLHTLHYQVLCSNGQMTPTMSTVFMRINFDVDVAPAKTFRYWFDDEMTAQEVAASNGVQMLDASTLQEGLHTIHYQIRDSRGALGSTVSSIFMKMNQTTVTTANSIRYWFDNDATSVKEIDVAQGTQTLDVTDLLAGLHTLNYQLIDSEGKVGVPVTRLFMRNFDNSLAEGGNRITRYQYWLNDNSQAKQTVMLDNAANPYTLISLLPMQKEPINSALFLFEITDGQPTIYAKNVFHIRFHDAQDYFTDGDKTFVDYSVKQELTDMEWLESGVRATTAKPTENAIKWYCLEAEPGDSLQFKLDRAATFQLFSPSGKEIYHASGAESVKWSGLHASEAGIFYLALHDVTATYGNTISIDYNHIDKYAVLRQDISLVGNGGCSTITFEGNGFYNLKSVSLVNNNCDSIYSAYIDYISDSEVAVIFNFEDVNTCPYNACFDFGDEMRTVHNSIIVEESDSIKLKLKIEAPSQFLRSGSVTYTIRITNSGNSTAYSVPLELQLLTQSSDAISYAKFSDNIPIIKTDLLNGTDNCPDSIKAIRTWIEEQGDLLHFFIGYDSIEGRYFRECNFAINIAPKSSYCITLTLKSTETIELQALIPSKWVFCTYDDESITNSLARVRRAGAKETMCCYREKVECVMNAIVGALDFFSIFPQVKVADCIASVSNVVLQFSYDVWCGEKMGGKNPKQAAKDLIWDTVNSLVGCLIPAGDKWKGLQGLQWVYQHIYDNISTTMDCVKALTQEIPNCPPNNDRDGGKSIPVNSWDPNAVFGYTASSGSHAVKDGLTDVYYRIEFENDTTFATAAAHDIYVTDTLDATKFDLSTFTPTRVRIGEKSAELTGEKNFVTTIDMRPEINAIAQVEGTFDEQTGIARWHISSLDPMTMEPTQYVMDGVLPVNTDGRGIGEVMYDIQLKPGLAHGTEVNNRAGIVFDNNDVIMTPTWTNVIDRIAPVSHISSVEQVEDSETGTVTIEATDELSGPWRYDVYVQYGSGAWFKAAENVAVGTAATVKLYEGVEHHFYCVATDMAGNVEQKEPETEASLSVGEVTRKGDVNGDGEINAQDASLILQYVARKLGDNQEGFKKKAADANGDGEQSAQDASLILQHAAKKIDLTK